MHVNWLSRFGYGLAQKQPATSTGATPVCIDVHERSRQLGSSPILLTSEILTSIAMCFLGHLAVLSVYMQAFWGHQRQGTIPQVWYMATSKINSSFGKSFLNSYVHRSCVLPVICECNNERQNLKPLKLVRTERVLRGLPTQLQVTTRVDQTVRANFFAKSHWTDPSRMDSHPWF